MTDQELNRAVQYVTASTSYARDMVADIITIGFGELAALASTSTQRFERETLLEYVYRWTIVKTGQPEPLVREVLGCDQQISRGRDADTDPPKGGVHDVLQVSLAVYEHSVDADDVHGRGDVFTDQTPPRYDAGQPCEKRLALR